MQIWLPDGDAPAPQREGIELATRENTHINNYQCRDKLTFFLESQVAEVERSNKNPATKRRTDATAMYNCHGLVFANRRSEITDSGHLAMILREDGYREIPRDEALPGDVMVYLEDDGDWIHSAIVIEEPQPPLQAARVVSKWGCGPEYIHFANQCPYNYTNVKIYRVQ